MEALRDQLVDAEVRQAVMRLRVYDRTERNRADIHVFGQCDTGLAIHELGDWIDADRTAGQVFENTGIFTSNYDLMRGMSGGLLSGHSKATLDRVAVYNTNFPHGALEDENLPSASSFFSYRAMREIGIAQSTCHGRVVDYAVRVAGLRYAVRVGVDTGRYGDSAEAIKWAIEREAGVQVENVKVHAGCRSTAGRLEGRA